MKFEEKYLSNIYLIYLPPGRNIIYLAPNGALEVYCLFNSFRIAMYS